MSFLFWLLFLVWIFTAGVTVLVVLIQSGKGGGLSGLVGSGSAIGDTIGQTGAEKTLNRWTTYCAVGFMVLTILLVLLGNRVFSPSLEDTVFQGASGAPAPTAETQPAPVPDEPSGVIEGEEPEIPMPIGESAPEAAAPAGQTPAEIEAAPGIEVPVTNVDTPPAEAQPAPAEAQPAPAEAAPAPAEAPAVEDAPTSP